MAERPLQTEAALHIAFVAQFDALQRSLASIGERVEQVAGRVEVGRQLLELQRELGESRSREAVLREKARELGEQVERLREQLARAEEAHRQRLAELIAQHQTALEKELATSSEKLRVGREWSEHEVGKRLGGLRNRLRSQLESVHASLGHLEGANDAELADVLRGLLDDVFFSLKREGITFD
ncbi:MAG: hypothetical protein HY814_11390 [Candidatus Riflebacteria bacterium]|nr:hypothetical protein [Candidatus Riflebacteria bacterium]